MNSARQTMLSICDKHARTNIVTTYYTTYVIFPTLFLTGTGQKGEVTNNRKN